MKNKIFIILATLLMLNLVAATSYDFVVDSLNGNTINIQGISTFNIYSKNDTFLNFSRGLSAIIKDDPKYSPANSQNQFTVSSWIKIPTWEFPGQSATSEYVNYIQKKNTSGTGCEWEFRIENATGTDTYVRPCRLSFYVFNKTCGLGAGAFVQNNATISSCEPEMINQWISVIGGIGIDNNTFIYVNGQKNDPSDNNALSTYGITTADGIGNITIGRDLDSTAPYFQGQMQDLRIYNKTLTSLEVAQISDIGIAQPSKTYPVYNDSWMVFNGPSGYLQNDFSNFTNNMTFTGWINTSQYQQMVILGSSDPDGMLLRVETDGKMRFFANLTSGSNWATINITPSYMYFFAVTFNNDTRNASLFINGLFNASTIITTNYLTDLQFLQIGRRGGVANYFNGTMDDIGVYDRLLTPNEILSIYNAGRNNDTNYNPNGIASFFNFNESRYRVAVDSSPNRFDADMFGGTSWGNDGVVKGTLTYSLPTDQMVGNWKMNEGNGSKIYDSTIYANNGTTNATWMNDGINLLIDSGNYTTVLTTSRLVLTWADNSYNHLLGTLDYSLTGIESSCAQTISNFTGIIVIVGLLLAIVLIVAVVGILASSFGVIPDVDMGSVDLRTVLISVAIVSVVAILIIFVIYMFEAGLCPAFGG